MPISFNPEYNVILKGKFFSESNFFGDANLSQKPYRTDAVREKVPKFF